MFKIISYCFKRSSCVSSLHKLTYNYRKLTALHVMSFMNHKYHGLLTCAHLFGKKRRLQLLRFSIFGIFYFTIILFFIFFINLIKIFYTVKTSYIMYFYMHHCISLKLNMIYQRSTKSI